MWCNIFLEWTDYLQVGGQHRMRQQYEWTLMSIADTDAESALNLPLNR